MRKILILLILIGLISVSYIVIAKGLVFGIIHINSYSTVKEKSTSLDKSVKELEQKTTTEFNGKKALITTAIDRYKSAKEEFEALEESQKQASSSTVDLVDIDFLWTIIGNYATENDVLLQFDVKESPVKKNTTTTYLLCDLYFKSVGNYTDVTKFIYDIEDDDRLKFEINEFNMIKHDVKVTATQNMTAEDIDAERNKQENWVDATFVAKGIPLNITGISEISTLDIENAIDEINAVLSNQAK